MGTVADDDQVKSTHDVACPTFLMVARTAGAKEALMRLTTNITIIGNTMFELCYFVYDILAFVLWEYFGNTREFFERTGSSKSFQVVGARL